MWALRKKRAASQEKGGGRRNKRATAEVWKRIKRSLEKGIVLIKKKKQFWKQKYVV